MSKFTQLLLLPCIALVLFSIVSTNADAPKAVTTASKQPVGKTSTSPPANNTHNVPAKPSTAPAKTPPPAAKKDDVDADEDDNDEAMNSSESGEGSGDGGDDEGADESSASSSDEEKKKSGERKRKHHEKKPHGHHGHKHHHKSDEESDEDDEGKDQSSAVTEHPNDAEASEETQKADSGDKRLFSAKFEDELSTISIRNHSKLAKFMLDALAKDKLFTLHRHSVVLREKFVEPKRSSHLLFNQIRDMAMSYYSDLSIIRKMANKRKQKRVIHALVAEQFNNIFGEVLENSIKTLDGMAKDLVKRKRRDSSTVAHLFAQFFRNESSPHHWKSVKKIEELKRLLQDHHKNKFKTYREAIEKRLPEDFRSEKDVPNVLFEDLEEEDESSDSGSGGDDEPDNSGDSESAGGDDEGEDLNSADSGEDDEGSSEPDEEEEKGDKEGESKEN